MIPDYPDLRAAEPRKLPDLRAAAKREYRELRDHMSRVPEDLEPIVVLAAFCCWGVALILALLGAL
jgi:hypothetical protein